jgi:hypothetical protein
MAGWNAVDLGLVAQAITGARFGGADAHTVDAVQLEHVFVAAVVADVEHRGAADLLAEPPDGRALVGAVRGHEVDHVVAVDDPRHVSERFRRGEDFRVRALAIGGLAIVQGERNALVLDDDPLHLRERLRQDGDPLRDLRAPAFGVLRRLQRAVADHVPDRHPVEKPEHVLLRPAGDDRAGIQPRRLGQQVPRRRAHRRRRRFFDDGRERPVEVEGEQCIGPGDALQNSALEDRLHQATPSTLARPPSRLVSRCRCRSRAASASIRPAQR